MEGKEFASVCRLSRSGKTSIPGPAKLLTQGKEFKYETLASPVITLAAVESCFVLG